MLRSWTRQRERERYPERDREREVLRTGLVWHLQPA